MSLLQSKIDKKLQQLNRDALKNINSASFLGCVLFLCIQSLLLIKIMPNDVSLSFDAPLRDWVALVVSFLMTSLFYGLKKKTETLLLNQDIGNSNHV